ncbi:hypothetical protein PLICRDRAFT_86996 [Plicaturopsis crispa FD-325 SS-3]|nr:hypothetical protein PLICRDRAFT_86996 [Plicaturopsis crispa FD-325 SS-3]
MNIGQVAAATASLIMSASVQSLNGQEQLAPQNGLAISPPLIVGHPTKKRRATTACVGCRSRKTRCAAEPPGPCRPCIDAGSECAWSMDDGRKRRKKNAKQTAACEITSLGQMSDGVGFDSLVSPLDMGTSASFSFPSQLENETFSGGSPDVDSWLRSFDLLPSFTLPQNPESQNPGNAIPGSSSRISPPFDCVSIPGNFADSLPFSEDTILGLSSILPMVQFQNQADSPNASQAIPPSPTLPDQFFSNPTANHSDESKLVSVTWFRPHGPTAIAPGLKRVTLKLRRHAQTAPGCAPGWAAPPAEILTAAGLPSPAILPHLLDLFFKHMQCFFPSLDRSVVDRELEEGTANALLINCMAAVAARFSNHPALQRPSGETEAYERGDVFGEKAKQTFLVPMLSLPSREAVVSLMLLAHYEFGRNSEAGLWMYVGMACRMAQDLGLHCEPSEQSELSLEERRLNRLVFWSVLILDSSLSFGTGRPTTIRLEEIDVRLPEDSDIHLTPAAAQAGVVLCTNAFPYAARQMLLYGTVLNMLNSAAPKGDDFIPAFVEAKKAFIKAYQEIPPALSWGVTNFKNQVDRFHGSIFLQLHLFFFVVMSISHSPLSRSIRMPQHHNHIELIAEVLTCRSASATLSSVSRTIGEIFVLADVIEPMAFMAAPFVNQALFVASCAFVHDVETYAVPSNVQSPAAEDHNALEWPSPPTSSETSTESQAFPPPQQSDASRTFLSSMAATNLSVLRQGLRKQARYWSGVGWVEAALAQRMNGIQDVDLSIVSDAIKSFITLPDEGAFRQFMQKQRRS